MSALDTYYAYAFLKILTQDWKKTDAYKNGLIDDKGNLTKPFDEFSRDEKKLYTTFDRLVFNIKRLLEKFPLGRSISARYASAIYLLKEHLKEINIDSEKLLEMFITEYNLKESLLESKEDIILKEGWYCLENELFEIKKSLKPSDRILGKQIYEYDNRVFCLEEISTANIDGNDTFIGAKIFRVNPNTHFDCRNGKGKRKWWKKFLQDEELGKEISTYSKTNPKKNILLQNQITGSYFYIKKVS